MKFSRAIRHLNMKDVNRKQLQKEKALKEGMNTSNIYPEVSEVQNPDLSNFEAIMTGGERLGFSGADGNTAGNASLGDAQGLTGVALSPPHPVTGVRINAVHVTTGLGNTTPLRPGVTISRGFSDNPPQYTMGSVLWFYDMDFDNGAGQPAGKWCNLEYSNFEGETNGKWFFWDTIKSGQFAGIYIANTDLSQHPCGDISDLIDGLNFPNGSLGPEKIPVLTQKGLETEPIYPGPIANLFGLGQRAFEWMKEKAEEFKGNFQSNTEGLGQELKNHWGETWNDVTGFVEAIIEVGQEMGAQAAGLLDGLNNLYAISGVANEAKNNGHITDDNQIKEGEKGSITNPHENFISDGTARHILRGVDLDGPNIGAQIQSNVEANPLSGGGNWGSKGIHNNLPGKGVNPNQYPSPYIDSEGNLHIPDTYLFAKHGFLPRKYSPTGWDQEKVMGGQNPHVKFTVQGLADLNYYWSKATGSSETEAKQNAQETANGVAAFFDKSIGNILPGTVGPNSPLIHFETIIPKNQIERILGNQGITNESYISESAKLGHFEPDILDVDINDIRKGIMPEYPKQPPAEMIDGYHQKSALRPKPLDNEPYVRITKADLIRNHRIKPSEVDEMMDTINRLNDYIKKHPEDLIYVQQRYPKDDPRLAELNWKMDQMLNASEDYLEKNFKENKKLFNRAIDRTKNNIKLTDPKYAQQRYDELRGTVKPKKTNLVGRLGKHLNKYESKGVLRHVDSDDFKKIRERKLEKKKFLEKQEQKRLDYINDINAEMDEFKSDWRKDISESDFTNITKGNRIGQTFQHASGATITIDNTMSDPSDQPSQVTLDLGFGEKITVDAPSGNEYGIAGITSHLGASGGGVKELDKKVMQKQNVKTAGEINQQLDASEKASGAESARVEGEKPKFKFGIDDPTMPGVMTEDPEIAMNEKLYKFQKIYTDTVEKNTKIRDDHERTVISPYVNKLLSPLKLRTPGTSKKLILYKQRQISSEDGKIYITLETDDKKTTFKKYTLTNRGYVLSSEKSFDQPRLRSLPVMPKFLQDWQSQYVDPTGAIPRSDGAIIAEKSGVKSAFDVLNYYLDNHVKTGAGMDPSRKDIRHNLTHLITDRTKDILRKGMDKLAADGKLDDGGKPIQRDTVRDNVNQYFKQHGVLGDNKLAAQLQKVDIYNSLGNDLGFDVEHYNKTGNYRFNSTYKFTSTLDMGVRVPVAGAVISLLSRKYVSGQLDGETGMAVQNPMQFRVEIESGKKDTQNVKGTGVKNNAVSGGATTKTLQGIKKPSTKTIQGIKKLSKSKFDGFNRGDLSFKRKKKKDK